MFITKDSNGQIIWLESGNTKSGLFHIMNGNRISTFGHEADFASAFGLSPKDVPGFLKSIIETGSTYTVNRDARIYPVPGSDKSVGIVIGDNGYIITADPCK